MLVAIVLFLIGLFSTHEIVVVDDGFLRFEVGLMFFDFMVKAVVDSAFAETVASGLCLFYVATIFLFVFL
jgi:hypothetical protein